MKVITWNVNGIRSRIFNSKTNSFKYEENSSMSMILKENPDFICLQETRCSLEIGYKFKLEGYLSVYNQSKLENARGPCRYSGTAIYYKEEIMKNHIGTYFQIPEYEDLEGRIIIIEFCNFIIINLYTPNSGTNFNNRIKFQNAMEKYINIKINENKKIIYAGDLNVARNKNDIYHGYLNTNYLNKTNIIGYLPEERSYINKLINEYDLKDSYLEINSKIPENGEEFMGYTWWDPKIKSKRINNEGWRIDYILLYNFSVIESKVLKNIGEQETPHSSDHAVLLTEFE